MIRSQLSRLALGLAMIGAAGVGATAEYPTSLTDAPRDPGIKPSAWRNAKLTNKAQRKAAKRQKRKGKR